MSPHPDSSLRSNRFTQSGFTLVEVLVALALLTIALVPIFTLSTNALRLSARISNLFISTNLAQEGIEVVRAIRDADWFQELPFGTSLALCATGCTVQYDSSGPLAGVSVTTPLKLDPATGLYQYTTGTATIFQRASTVTSISAVHLKVVSEVTWTEQGTERTTTLEYHLFDWFP